MKLEVSFSFSRRLVLSSLAVLALAGGAGGVWLSLRSPASPVPDGIEKQLAYKVIYPSDTKQIKPGSFSYVSQQHTLTFNVDSANDQIVFAEQPAPSNLGSNGQVYFQAIGLHPYAQFESTLGLVALARFYQTGSLDVAGESAVLASHGTLVIAHSSTQLGNDVWKNLFDSLKLAP